MHTCIPSHRLKISWHSCSWHVNTGNNKKNHPKTKQNTASMHHPGKWNVTTSMVGITNIHMHIHISTYMKISHTHSQNGEHQILSWQCRRRTRLPWPVDCWGSHYLGKCHVNGLSPKKEYTWDIFFSQQMHAMHPFRRGRVLRYMCKHGCECT